MNWFKSIVLTVAVIAATVAVTRYAIPSSIATAYPGGD